MAENKIISGTYNKQGHKIYQWLWIWKGQNELPGVQLKKKNHNSYNSINNQTINNYQWNLSSTPDCKKKINEYLSERVNLINNRKTVE